MADRIASDHPTVTTVRATLEQRTTGVSVAIPADSEVGDSADVVLVVIGGDERFARIESSLTGGDRVIRAVYASPGAARDPSGEPDRLREWVEGSSVRIGGSVLVDVIESDFLYGLRAPGETAYYEAKEPPSDSLQSIAESLED